MHVIKVEIILITELPPKQYSLISSISIYIPGTVNYGIDHTYIIMSSKNALDILMKSSNKKKKRPVTDLFFDCPLGCGAKVTEQDVNIHLDNCIGKHSTDNNSTSNNHTKQTTSESINTTKRTKINDAPNNAFSHMMKQSASVFKKNNIIRHRFHLHNVEGFVTWTTNYDEDTNIIKESVWSATTLVRKVKTLKLDTNGKESSVDDRELELTISSSVPCLQGDKPKLVCKHSRFSVRVCL